VTDEQRTPRTEPLTSEEVYSILDAILSTLDSILTRVERLEKTWMI
jgi:hypothetical protein